MKASAAATPIAITMLAAGAVAYAYIVDRRTVSDADRAARRRDVFPSFRAEDVARVEMEHGQETLVLERDVDSGTSDAWLMTSPRHERADAAAVDTLLRELEMAVRLREVDQVGSVGLETPRVRGAVTVGALRYLFAIGADAARPEGGAYMRVDGEGTFVVDRSLKVQLLRGADAYRDRMIVRLRPNEIARLDVGAADGRAFSLERSERAFHVAGSHLRASRSAVERIFAALADARADSFLQPHEAEVPATPALTLTVAPLDASQANVVLYVGGACKGQPDEVVLVRASPSVVETCTSKVLVDTLASTKEGLVDRSVLSAHADEIEEIRLETVGGAGKVVVDLARKSTGWHERAPDDHDLDSDESDSASELVRTLVDAQAVDVRRATSDDRTAPRARATFVRTGGGPTEVVELEAPRADGSVLARRVEDDAVLRLASAVAHRFEPHPTALRSRVIWRPSFDPGAVVAIDNGCTPVGEHVELHNGTWMRTPAGFIADPRSIAELAGTVAHARADGWIAESDDGSFGFDRPGSCAVTLVTNVPSGDGATRRVTIVFGADAGPGVYARVADDPAVFVAPKTMREVVSHPAVDRSRLRLDPTLLKSVTLIRGADHLVLERSGEGLIRTERAATDAAEVGKIEAALADFCAQVAVHTGPPAGEEGMDRPTLEIRARSAGTDADSKDVRITIGAPGQVDTLDVYFARASGVDATFAVQRRIVDAILAAW